MWKMTWQSFLQEERLYNLKGYDLERDLLNLASTGLFSRLYGLLFLKSAKQKLCQESCYYKDAPQ